MQDAKEEVRSRLNIEDVIGEYVQLKRAGRNFKGLSPFTGEKTPSFFVSPEKSIWHDFSSNKGGDVFSFVMEVEGMDFRQALEHLARKAGVDLSMYESKGVESWRVAKKRALEASAAAALYFQHSLVRNRAAMDYVFRDRQLNRSVFESFQLGYAPDNGSALVDYLKKKKFTQQELQDAGLLNRRGTDLFRGRMMVPLMDTAGQVIGFTGRITKPIENAPKYLNTPQTILYDKGRHVFGLSQAKEAIRHEDHVVVVEGNLDVVSSHQAGVKQVVATAGTAMTAHHLRALKRLTSDVRLAFDGDKAGIAATERAIGLNAEVGVELTIISLPEGVKDPDELVRSDVAQWKAAIATSQPAVDWVLEQHEKRVDITSAAGKRAFTTAALEVVRYLSDPVEIEHYEQKIASMIGTTLEAIHSKRTQQASPARELKKVADEAKSKRLDAHAYQDDALAVACVDVPSQELFAHLDPTLLDGEARQAMARYFATHHQTIVKETPKELQEFDTYVKILLLRADARYAEWDSNSRIYETARLIRQIENEHKKQTRDTLTSQLRDAEAGGDESTADALRVELNTLIKEIARGKRR